MMVQGNAIKIRLLQIGKNQRDLADSIKAQGVKVTAAQISNAINRPEGPKEIEIRDMINDLLMQWESEAKSAR